MPSATPTAALLDAFQRRLVHNAMALGNLAAPQPTTIALGQARAEALESDKAPPKPEPKHTQPQPTTDPIPGRALKKR